MQEQWKVIDGCSNYEVSNYGRVRNKITNIIIKEQNHNGYSKIGVRSDEQKTRKFRVHRLVALNFIVNDDPLNKKYVNHKDGNKKNNHYTNLEWCTSKENTSHGILTNLIPDIVGENNINAKLTEHDVIVIRNEFIKGDPIYGYSGLASRFSVDVSVISKIVNFKIWKHVST